MLLFLRWVRASRKQSHHRSQQEQYVNNLPRLTVYLICHQPIDEVMRCLVEHRCQDITADIDYGLDNEYITRGGFGAIYSGRLRNGQTVAVKCLEVLTSQIWTDESYDDNLKVAFRLRRSISPTLTLPSRIAHRT